VGEPRAWKLFEQLWDTDPSILSRDQLLLVALAGVRQEINSGGFDSYFRYSYGDHAPFAVEAANEVGSAAFAALISEGMARLGLDPYPGDPSVREASIDDHELEFGDLDQAYYDLEAADDLDARMETLAVRIP
jgi:hypothetical protein